jgi:hypothetical protein
MLLMNILNTQSGENLNGISDNEGVFFPMDLILNILEI